MIVRIPFFLVGHLFLVFIITTLTVSGQGHTYEEVETVGEYEPEYYNEIPQTYERVVYAEEPVNRYTTAPRSVPSNRYYYVEEPVMRQYSPPRKPVNYVRNVAPTYYEEVVMPPSRPPIRAPMQVFEDTDMC